MRKLVATAIALAVLPVIALVMPDSGVRAGSFPGENGRIAFTAETAAGHFDIASAMPNGDDFVNLTPTPELEGISPDWSADSTQIAFIGITEAAPNGEIYTMDADGANPVEHPSDAFDLPANPSWSPDGTQIVFSAEAAGGGFGLWVLTLDPNPPLPIDSDEFAAITDNTANNVDLAPAWSPGDGEFIAYTFVNGNDGEGNGVYTVNADGTNEQLVTEEVSPDTTVSWSPDGLRLVFDNDFGEIVTIDAEGSEVPEFVSDAGIQPAWSPDGLKITYANVVDDPLVSIHSVDVDGNNDALVFDDDDSSEPSWGSADAPPATTTTTSTSTTSTTTTTTTTTSTTSTSTTSTSTTSTSTTSTTVRPTTTTAPPATTTTTRAPLSLPSILSRTGGEGGGWLWAGSALALLGAALLASTGGWRRREGAHFKQ